MEARWRNAAFVGAAILAHAVIFAVMPIAKYKHPKPSAPTFEIEVEQTPSGTTAGGAGASARTIAHETGAKHAAFGRSHGGTMEAATLGTEVAPPAGSAQTADGAPLPSILGAQSIGLEGPGSFRTDAAKDLPTEAQIVADNVHHAIVDPLRAHDVANGDLTSGPVAQELERTTRRLDGTPFEGRAVFSIDVDELGLVVKVGVSESSGDRRAWDEVARAVLNALAQKRLHMPAGAKHVAMQIEISSKVALPSGGQHPMTVDSPAAQGLAHMAQGQFDRAGDTPSIVSGSFDISDIGSHPRRVVGARVLSQQSD